MQAPDQARNSGIDNMTIGFAEHAPSAPAGGGTPVRPPSRERMKQWVTAAQTGARLPLGTGFSQRAALGPDLFELVTSLFELGYIRPHTTRDPETRQLVYIAVRTGQPLFRSTRL